MVDRTKLAEYPVALLMEHMGCEGVHIIIPKASSYCTIRYYRQTLVRFEKGEVHGDKIRGTVYLPLHGSFWRTTQEWKDEILARMAQINQQFREESEE